MPSYLETIYFRDEYAENKFPQKLCDHLIEKIINPHFSGTIKEKVLLDVGSGKGNHLVGFNRRGFIAKGLDSKLECLETLKDFDVRRCDIELEKFPYDNEEFDVVFSKSVLEHIWNADNFLEETSRVLRKGGMAILMTPDWRTQHEIFWDDYTHVKAWTRKSLQNALRIKNFNHVNVVLFRQLPILWSHPWLKILCDLTALLPHSLKWKDSKEEKFREFIRFSKEKMLLAIAIK